MRRIIYACLLFAFAFGPAGVAHAQVILYTEGFETNGEGTRYTSNTFTTGASCDFWERSAASPLNTCFNLPNLFTNFQGSFFWGSEDVRIGGVNPNGQLTSSPITITNYNSLTVSLFFAATNGGFLRWEITDEVNIQASFDGGPFTTVGRFIGKDPGSGGDLVIDANLNGVGDPGETVVVSSPAFTKYTFSIPGTGNSLRVRVETNQSGGSEEMGWDVLEVRGVFAPPVCLPPSITCPSTQNLALNSSCEATVPDYTSLGTPVGGTCGPMTVVQSSPTIGSTVSGGGTFSVTLFAQNTAMQGSTNTCSFTVNKTTPEINVQGNGNTILDGDGSASLTDHTDFGAILVCSGTIVRTFTIQNAPGTRALNITSVTFSGGNSGDFLVSAAPASSVAISGSTTFQVTFNPSGAGVRSTTLNIVTDDCDETTYNFAISGFGNADASAPTITCPSSQNLVLNPCAANLPDYTSLATGLTDNCPGMPTVTQSPAIGSSQSGVGAMTVTLTATDGSSNFTTCTFTVNKVAPEMGVTGNSVAIASGDLVPGLADHTDFGSVIVGNNIVRTFTITNSGPSNLTLGAGSITTVGADFAQFVVGGISLPVSIPQGLSATFTVTFTPGSLGLKTTTVNIANNDCDENPYTFAIQGTGTAAGPEMNVTGNGQSIADGDMLPTTTDHSDFGSVLVCSGTIVRTFTIENVSGTNLTVGAVTLGGAHPGDFVVSASPGSPITSGSNTTFQVTFNPSATGLRTATISIVNNDADENPYDFAIQGTGNADIVNPTITCPANVSVNAGAGVCQATVTFTAPVGADNCAGPVTTQTAGLASGASFPVGVTTNTFRVTDGSGNTATCSFTVTVTDAQLPTITCPANISLNTDPGICTATATYTAPVGADNCPGQTTVRTGGLASGSIYPRGVTTNTFRVTDASGNTATCSFTVTVTDNQLPSITCPSNVSTNNDPGLCSKVVTYTAPIGTDNCTGQSTTQIAGLASGAAYPIGVTTNTFRVTDGSGNTATCSFTVTVTDNQLPVITCPANMSSITNNLDCISATVVYTTPAGTDNCPGQSTTQLVGLASGSSFPTGVTTNTFRVTDAAGNTATCSFTVTVTALVNQTVTIADDTLCPNTGTTVSTASSQTGWSYTLRNDLNSALVAGPLAGTGSALNFNTGPVATTTTYNVTAESPSALLFDGVDDVVNFGNDLNLNLGEYTVEAWVYRTTGNITVSRKFHQHDFGILNNGSMFFNWGNGGSCVWQSGGIFTAAGVVPANQWVHVAWRQMNGSGLDFLVNGTVVFNAGGFHNFTTLNCGQDRYTTTSAPGNKIDDLRIWGVPRSAIQITGNMTACLTGSEPGLLRYYKFTDGGGSSLLRDHSPAAVNGVLQNMDVNNAWIGGVTCVGCSQEMTPTVTATIRDLFPTVATTTPNQSVNTTIGTCGAVVTYTAPTFNDDCDGNGLAGTRIAGLASGATFPVGVTTVTYRYTDASAQSVTSSFTVTVTDNQAPTISCPPNVTTASSPGVCVATAFTYLTPSINDNCPSATLLQVAGLSSGSNFPLGVTTNTFQVTDASGNTATCSFTVTVNDLQNPTITCPANISVSASVGVCNAVVSYTAPVGADNCPSQSTAQTAGLASGASFPTGVTTNTFRVTDGSGNSATCSFTVTVSDNQLPTITCPANISVTVTPGLCNATVSYTAPVGADNCPGQTTTQTAGLASGASFPTGVTTNTFRVTDASANSATCSFTVTVTDNQLPTITCPSNVSGNNDPGLCGKVVTFTAPVGADNCSGQLTTQIAGLASGSTFPIGVTTNTFRVTDASGNTATCSFTVTISDNQAPGITCPANISIANSVGLCSATVTYTAPVGSDNCPSPTTTQTAGLASGAAFPVGVTTNVFRTTDASGNSTTCSFTVTVNDTEVPTITCPANLSVSNDLGLCGAVVNYSTPAGSDNCPGHTVVPTSGLASGAVFPVGLTTNTFRVTDASGNSATCSFTVTVNDTELPVLLSESCVTSNASGAAYNDGWQSGDNDGAGFGPWVLNASTGNTSQAGFFTGPSTVNGAGVDSNLDGDINSTGRALGMYANSAQATQAVRPILVPFVVGSRLRVEFDNGFLDPGQITGFQLQNSSGLSLGEMRFRGGQPTYELVDANGITPFGSIPFTDQGLIVEVTSLSSTLASIKLTRKLDGATQTLVSTLFPGGGNQVIGRFMVFNSNAGVGTPNNLYVNNMQACTVTPGCPPNVSVPASPGLCSAAITYSVISAIDNCGASPVVQNSGLSSGAPFPVGVTNNSFSVSDLAGNSATCSFTVTVSDNQLPTITCPANVSVNTNLGVCGAVVTYTTPVGADNCSGSSTNQTAGLPSNATFPVGTTTNSFLVTDASSNSATCSFTVTVTDAEAPTAVCQNISLHLNGAGNATLTAAMVNNGSSDACGIASLGINTSSFTCANVGPNSVILTVSDVNGNSSTCTSVVTVVDSIDPVATCQNITVHLNNGGAATVIAAMINNGSSDVCGIASLTLINGSFSCANVGPNSVTLTVTDVNGNSSTCTSVVTVIDSVDPTAVCQNVTVQLNSLGNGSTTAAAVNNGSSDACGIQSLSLSQSAFVCGEVGANTEVLTVTDVNGNTSTCSTVITVQDNIAPIATCQNVTVQLNNTGNGTTTAAAVNNGSSDACGIQSLVLSQTAFVCSEVGANTEVLTVTDVNGNTSTCTTVITVQDNVAPVATCQSVTVQLDNTGNGSTTAAAVNNGSSDACGIQSLSLSQTAFVCAEVGANTEILTVTDVNGNTSTCATVITVQDNVAPIATCQNITVQLNNAGTVTTTAGAVNNGSTDACGIQTLGLSQLTFVCSEVGTNTEVLTVTDVNGNTSTCTTTITVQDNVVPVAICQNVTVQLNNTGNGSTTAAAVNNGSSDACGIQSLVLTQTAFVCAEVGANTEVLTVTDVNGNSSTCATTITVQDNIAPIAVCQNITAQLNSGGTTTVTAVMINNGSSDACGIATLSLNNGAFGCANVGQNSIVMTVTDVNGNTSTCAATVAIMDTVRPVAICQNVTIQLNVGGNATLTTTMVNNGSSDACGIQSLALSQSAFVCSEVGANNEVLTVTDVNGNSSTCATVITVQDNIAPVAICQNVTVQLDITGNGATSAAAVNNGSTDACGIQTLTLSQTAFVCSEVGANTEVLTVTDVNGNSTTCSVTVTVQDNIAPNATCQNLTSYLNGGGTSTITASMVNNGSSDACGIATSTINNGVFGCANVGANTVVLTIVDVNGNSATCSSVVTVIDSIDPTPVCQNLTVYLDAQGVSSITPSMVNNGSSDICGIGNLALSVSAFTCGNVGNNSTVLTVTDVNGNTSTCGATIAVMDTISPSIICPNSQTLFADSSVCGAIATWNVPATSDNCAVDTVVFTHPSGTLFPIGTTTVGYGVVDVNANSSTCSFTVTVDPVPLQVVISSPLQGCGYHLACALDSTANLATYVSGGCLPYSYVWSTGDTSVNIGSLPSGTYHVTVTDSRGTTASDSLVVTAPDLLQTQISGDTIACEFANTATLVTTTVGGQDCAAYSYVWSTGATTSGLTSQPAGTYVVSVTDSLGCFATDTAIVQLDTIPVLVLGPDTTTCPGIAVVFEAPPVYTAYQWNTGSTNSVITMTTPGMYICQIWTVAGCTDTDTVNLVEHVVDMDIITPLGNILLCDGDTLTLEGDSGLTNYGWSTGDTTQSIDVFGFGGPVILSAWDGNGCATADTIVVNYVQFTDPQPVIAPGPTAPLCDGGSRQLDVQSGYFAYAWSTGATTQTIFVNTPGVYIVTVSNGFGCTDVSEPVTVYSVPLPTPSIVYNSGVLSTTIPFVTYQWLLGGIPIPGAIQATYEPLQSGWYSVAATDSNGCEGFSTQLFVNPVGVTEEVEDLNGLTLYPNPSRGTVNLRTLNAIDWPVQVEIWDMFGQKVRVFDMAHLMDVVAFDLNDLSAAPYLMKITTFRKNTTQQAVLRFVKQ